MRVAVFCPSDGVVEFFHYVVFLLELARFLLEKSFDYFALIRAYLLY
jgi:hypothetical protein